MVCSLKCFCDFVEASSPEQRNSVIKRYKKGTTEPSKGMIVYYSPALQLMRGRLCPDGSMSDKLKTLQEKCFIDSWPDKLNDARLEANTLALKGFHAVFGNKKLKVFSSPRLQCLISTDLAVSLQPEIYAEIDGVTMVWKFNMSKHAPTEQTIRYILQMLGVALEHKGISIPVEHICYFDLRAGKIYVEHEADVELMKKLRPAARAFTEAWEKAA